jgi:hypothetical protein
MSAHGKMQHPSRPRGNVRRKRFLTSIIAILALTWTILATTGSPAYATGGFTAPDEWIAVGRDSAGAVLSTDPVNVVYSSNSTVPWSTVMDALTTELAWGTTSLCISTQTLKLAGVDRPHDGAARRAFCLNPVDDYNHFRWWSHAGATLIDASIETACIKDYLPWHCIVAYNQAREDLVADIRQVAATHHWSVEFPLLTGQYPADTGTDGIPYDGAVRLLTVNQAPTISWSTTATAYRNRTGDFTFVCPANGYFYAVAGTYTYTDDSSICTAATHAGVITKAAGGTVTITPDAGTPYYIGTTRNGVTTNSYATSYAGGFTITGGTTAPGGISWSRNAVEFRGKNQSFTFICPANGYLYAVAGTGTYTDDSSICTAATHAGVITKAAGGTVTITPNGGTATYVGTTQNGVTTRSYSLPYPGFTVG